MEIDDGLDVFRETVLLDQAFTEHETCLDARVINELSIHNLERLTIEFKHNKVILSSVKPFRLNRTREKLVINYEACLYAPVCKFLSSTLQAPRIHRDEENPQKVYTNRYRDEVYMKSLDLSNTVTITPLHQQTQIVNRQQMNKLNLIVLDHLIETGKVDKAERDLFLWTLRGDCHGFLTEETLALFRTTKEAYIKSHSTELADALEQELALVERWGSLGEADMMRRIEHDMDLYTRYNELNATRRTEWILSGSELHQLRFFNLHDAKEIDFYNRTFIQRPICHGPHTTLAPYEHMLVHKHAPVKVSPIQISYSAKSSQ